MKEKYGTKQKKQQINKNKRLKKKDRSIRMGEWGKKKKIARRAKDKKEEELKQ